MVFLFIILNFLLIDLIATNAHIHTHTYIHTALFCLIPFIFALHSSFLYSKPYSSIQVPWAPAIPVHACRSHLPQEPFPTPPPLGFSSSPGAGKMDGSWRIMALAFFSLGEKDDFEMPLICLPDFPSRTVLGAHIESPISLPTSLLVLPLGISTFSQACCELLIYSGDQDTWSSSPCEFSLMVFPLLCFCFG